MKKVSLFLSVVCFLTLAISVTSLFAQTRRISVPSSDNLMLQGQDVINAVQERRLSDIEKNSGQQDNRINTISQDLSSLTNSMNRFTGIGIGIGVTLTVLQALQLILQVKKTRPQPTVID